MVVNYKTIDKNLIFPVSGVELGVARAGIRKACGNDVTVITLCPGSVVAGAFTQNRFCAAPVQVCQQHLSHTHQIRALLINTGNANAGTGKQGLDDAQHSCAALSQLLNLDVQEVLPFSTGVIMEPLPLQKMIDAIPLAIQSCCEEQWLEAAQAIMTTDTVPKVASTQFMLGGQTVTITGMSKGSGMIHPNMATMLGYIATDVCIDASILQQMTNNGADTSFNCITVDGDTSTNDSFIVMATGKSAAPRITQIDSPDAQQFYTALESIAQQLAQAIVRDGEGATKLITITVEGGKTPQECAKVAKAIAHSPLVKTAFFASDPNLGRILAAVGYAGIDDLEQENIELFLDDVHVVTQGGRHENYQEEDGQRVMQQSEIKVRAVLGRGTASATVWTCDLSHDYVTINADYRS